MDSGNNNDDIEKKKINEIKDKFQDKKRTDSRNDQIKYHRKRMIQPVQMRQLSQEDFKFEEQFDEENVDFINQRMEEFKKKIICPSSEEELWKTFILFETISKKNLSINIKQTLASDLSFVKNLLELTQNQNLSEECKLGALQMLSEITDSFKNLRDIGPYADQQAFRSYLGVYRSARNDKTFANVLQAISQLCLDNPKTSEYFMQNGFYVEILSSFEQLMTQNAQYYLETIKDICIILHGLSKQQHSFDFNHQKLGTVFQFLIQTNDCDIHFDVSSAIDNIVKSYTSNTNQDQEWVGFKLKELYNLGLMKVILKLINQENVWIPVKGNKILSAISHINNEKIIKEFKEQIHDTGIFEQILQSIKTPNIMLVLKYHLFLTLKNLIEKGCINSQKYNYIIQNLLDPSVTEKSEQLQQQVVDTIWYILQKGNKEQFQIDISKQLIELLCKVLRDQQDVEFTKKVLDVFDKVMSLSSQDPNQKKHIKWLQKQDFNHIMHTLQQNKNDGISNKAVAVASYLDSDEDSDSDMEDENMD